jgi:hypothetical protein
MGTERHIETDDDVGRPRRRRHQLNMYALQQGLRHNTSLKDLNLSRNQLDGKQDVPILCRGLVESRVERLDLTSNNLGRTGLSHLSRTLPYLRQLQTLILVNTGNSEEQATEEVDEDDDGVDNLPLELIHGLRQNDSLTRVEISKVDWLSPTGPSRDGRSIRNIADTTIQRRSESDLLDYLQYYLALNVGGKQLLKYQKHNVVLPSGLWPWILERIHKNETCRQCEMVVPTTNPSSASALTVSLIPDMMFHLLREGPAVLHR